MKVSELIDILKDADPDKNVYVVDQYSCIEAKNFEIAPTGNAFIEFDNWYMKLLEERGYLKIPKVLKEIEED